MSGKPYRSSLLPYEAEIIIMRRKKPPISYCQIAELLCDKYQITISGSGIFEFIKRRLKKVNKPFKYNAWDYELPEANNQPAAGTKVIEKPTASKPSVSEKPKQTEEEEDNDVPKFKDVMKYSDSYNLTLLSPEEAAALEERIRRKNEREKQKQKEKR